MSKVNGTASRILGTPDPLYFRELSRFYRAADRARHLYPGSLGELAERELTAYADFGYRGAAGDSLIARLAAEILATPFPTSSYNGCAARSVSPRDQLGI